MYFVKTAHHGDYGTAARYLELPTLKQRQQGPELARQLLTLMDTSLVGSVAALSSVPDGFLDDSSDPNIEVVGRLVVQDKEVPFVLVRITDKDSGPVWRVSRQTLEQVPRLYELAGAPVLDQYFPRFLADHLFLDIPAGRWVAWLLSIPFALVSGRALIWFVTWLYQIRKRTTALAWSGAGKPAALIAAILFHGAFVYLIGIPLFYRVYYFRILTVLLTLCVAWFGVRVLDRMHERAIFRIGGRETQSFLQLGYQLLKVAVVIGAALSVFAVLGFDTKTLLAGLGIGGIAVALAAQKTLENLLGGITLVMDSTIYTGDDCVISGRHVTVRNIGLRSVVATTREGTDISFPNGMLVQSSIENLSRRSKFLIFTTLSLSSQCSLGQLRCLIATVREMLYAHARVEQETARFRLAQLRGSAYRVELFAYIRSSNTAEFAAIREDILFRISEMVEAVGAAWAVPSQLSYRSTNSLVNAERATEAEQTVQRWQDSNENPFPDFPAGRIAELRGTLPYPPEAAAPPERSPESRQIREAV